MPGFDVFDPHLDLYQNRFIEASAGTGKTFAIENLILRLLKDPRGPKLEEILAVTFTRKATFELKERIRKSLESATASEKDAAIQKRLQEALSTFEEAKIYTIHSFCFHTLKENALETGFFLDQNEDDTAISCKNVLKDFLRTEMTADLIHLKQLEKLLAFYQNKADLLVEKLQALTAWRLPICYGRPFSKVYEDLIREIQLLKERFSIKENRLYEDLISLAPKYRGFCTQKKELKKEIKEGLAAFAKLFTSPHDVLFDLPLADMKEENLLKKQPPVKALFYPGFFDNLSKVQRLLEELSDPLSILGAVAEKARLFLENVLQKKEVVFFEDLLRMMEKSLQNPSFVEKIRTQFKTVFIDEFQDTDPVQWRIFSTLFLEKTYKGSLYLIGDPKQSIYRFRGSDVYTYMQAKKEMGENTYTTLTRNFRSDPKLISAFNTLFSSNFLHLSKTGEHLTAPPLEVGVSSHFIWKDSLGALHFMRAEDEDKIFSYVIGEIARLCSHENLALKECAVLVKDRYQALRFKKACPFAVSYKKTERVAQTEGFFILQDCVKAALFPQDRGYLAKALAGPLFEVAPSAFDAQIALFFELHHTLITRGILPFFDKMVEVSKLSDATLYQEMLVVIQQAALKGYKPFTLLQFFETLKDKEEEENNLKAVTTNDLDALPLMTIHMSKGLEFSVVFALGLALSLSKKAEFKREKDAVVLSDSDEEKKEEGLRQLYVALTRAKKRVYVPLLEKEEESPIQLFLKNQPLETLLANENITISECLSEKIENFEQKRLLLHPPEEITPTFADSFVYSYTSLKTEKNKIFEATIPTTIPAGKETGILLHRIFEMFFSSDSLSEKNLSWIVQKEIAHTFLEPCASEVQQLLLNTLRMALKCHFGTFSLMEINPKKIVKEMEFFYPFEEPAGYCKGFVDLFFEHFGHYFFLDWKSNLLENYSEDTLTQAMQEQTYDLQLKLYKKGIEKYLHLFNAQVAGAFYVFVRGPGVLFFPFEEGEKNGNV